MNRRRPVKHSSQDDRIDSAYRRQVGHRRNRDRARTRLNVVSVDPYLHKVDDDHVRTKLVDDFHRRRLIISSNIPATGTVVQTSIITPKPTISTSLLTSCLSTRSTLPTAGLHVSTKRTKRKPSSSNGTNDDLVLDTSTTKERHHERFLPVERQVRAPSGLPSDCVSWTIRPVLSTATPPLSTSLETSTVVSTTQTTIWVPGETIWAGCEGSTSAKPSGDTAAVSSSTATVDTSSTPTGSASINAETNSSAVRTESPSVEILSSSAQQSSSSQISAPESSSSSSREWIDETTRLNSSEFFRYDWREDVN